MLDCSKGTPGMRWYPEPDRGTPRPGSRKAWVSGEGRTRSPWRLFAFTPGTGIVRRPRVMAPPRRNSFHHLAPVFPQELRTSTCWDVSAASRGEGKTRAGVEPPAPLPLQYFTGYGTDEGSLSLCWLLVLLEVGARAVCCLGAPLHPPQVLQELPQCPAFPRATDLRR